MPLNALKAKFTVHAGVIPGDPDPKLTKVWEYTSEDFAADQALSPDEGAMEFLDLRQASPSESRSTRFTRMHAEAMRYYSGLADPAHQNWATLAWYWV